jgi:glycosyltransferase involved in cell wall biosynthesis
MRFDIADISRATRRRERTAKPPRRRSRVLPNISVVFPAFNEELNLERVVRSALEILPGITNSFEIIVVNDGSRDQTGAVADRLASLSHAVRAIHHPTNRGYGAALKSGIEAAKKDLIFFCDSDGQFTLEDLHRLLAWIDRYDMVIGYREKRQDPFHRRLNAKGWNLLVRAVFGLRVRDIDCAFKVFRRKIFKRIQIDTVGAMVNTEILSRALRSGFTLKEVPVQHFPREFGEQTGAKLSVILKAFAELAKIYLKIYLTPEPAPVTTRRAVNVRRA